MKLHFNHRPQRDLHNSRSSPELRTIRVPIPTFPPTAMVYSVNNVTRALDTDSDSQNLPDYVSAAIMAKVLEERSKERLDKQEHCRVCWYRRHSVDSKEKGCQTMCPPSVLDLQNSNHIAQVHLRDRSESSSSIDSYCSRIRNGSVTSTETAI